MSHTLELMPIGDAPVCAGRTFGPCVLDLGRRLRIGYWDGERWCDRHDEPIAPLRYAPLPVRPETQPIASTA